MRDAQFERLISFAKDELNADECKVLLNEAAQDSELEAEICACELMVAAEGALVRTHAQSGRTFEDQVMHKIHLIELGLPQRNRFGMQGWAAQLANVVSSAAEQLVGIVSMPAMVTLGLLLIVSGVVWNRTGISGRNGQMAEVLVPTQNIEAGERIAPELFRKVSLPQGSASEGYIRALDPKVDTYARTLIVADAPLHRDYLVNLPIGHRTTSILIYASALPTEWFVPGTRADITWSGMIEDKPIVALLAGNVQILSVDQSRPISHDIPLQSFSVRVMASEEVILKLKAAQDRGVLGLVLRGDQNPLVGLGDGGQLTLVGLETLTHPRLR
ncbi:MAG: hypothetical protein DCC75_04920 [Proteobacteria bacterium]|nr:MAG: hypothetical protein DCC75_04920 [Pseudomonadota bacterium]